jgi:hypothetical protein
VCCCAWKKSRKDWRICAEVIGGGKGGEDRPRRREASGEWPRDR